MLYWIIILMWLSGAYPIIELTRIILINGELYYNEYLTWRWGIFNIMPYYWELALMWSLYILVPVILIYFTKHYKGLE